MRGPPPRPVALPDEHGEALMLPCGLTTLDYFGTSYVQSMSSLTLLVVLFRCLYGYIIPGLKFVKVCQPIIGVEVKHLGTFRK